MQAYFEFMRDYDDLFHIERPVNGQCDQHFHSNIEIIYVLDGEIDVMINGETRRMSKGGAAVSNSYDIHAYHTPEFSKTVFLIIPVNMVPYYKTIIDSRHFIFPFLEPGPYSVQLETAIEFLDEFDRTEGSMVSMGYIYVILGVFLKELDLVSDALNEGAANLMRDILIFLEKNYLSPLKISDLANRFGYNYSYLSRIFNSYINRGFNGYLNMLRARHAARLIQVSTQNLHEISYQSGFSSVRTFNRAFSSLYKMTPLEYKKHKKNPTKEGKEVDYMFRVYSYTPVVPEDS